MGIRDTYSLTMIILFVITFGMYIHSPVLAQSDNMAVQGSNTLAGLTGFNNITNLGAPLLIEHYKIISDKKTMVKGTEATEAFFMGNGTVNSINVTSTGKALVIPRSNGAAYIEGTADFKTTDNGNSVKATYVFQAIRNYGVVFFNSNSTGSLGFLNNMVGIYKVDMNEDGDNIFTMWNWSSPNN